MALMADIDWGRVICKLRENVIPIVSFTLAILQGTCFRGAIVFASSWEKEGRFKNWFQVLPPPRDDPLTKTITTFK